DRLTGGNGPDLLNGDAGDDTLIGFRGNDTMNGGPGNDRMIWNNGDGTDVMNGDDDNDVAEVNGAPAAGDAFTILPVAGRVAFSRTNLGLFSLDISTENLEVNSLGGDDVVSATPLPNTEVRLDGGAPASSDTLIANLQNQIIFLWPGRFRTEDSRQIFYVNFEVVDFVDAIFRLLVPIVENDYGS
ncbi:MAG TPA: hypothetical protein VNK95_18615, partial [Caldilineaceae bacterium]|nr:hypothetical protein [Caldilineaceae bacterium]